MLALSLAICLAIPAGEHLREYNRDDTELKTDLDTNEVDAVFELIATTRRAATDLFTRFEMSRKSSQSLRIRLFAHEADYEDFRRRTYDQRTDIQTMSFYNDQDRSIGAAWQGGSPGARGQLRGQIARQMLLNYSKNAPPWLREGIFCYFEGLEVDRFGDVIDTMNEQRKSAIRSALQRGDFAPLFDLMDMRETQFYGLAGAPNNSRWPRSTLEAESWSILYFVTLSEDPADRWMLKSIGERLDTGRWAQGATAKYLEGMEPRWREFLSSDSVGALGQTLKSAWAALERGDARSARDLGANAVGMSPTNPSAQRVLGHAALQAGDSQAAITSFEALKKLRPKDGDAWMGHARGLMIAAQEKSQPGAFDTAAAQAVAAAEHLPMMKRYEAYVLAAEIHEAKGDVKNTLKWVREARKQKGLSQDYDKQLEEWEGRLMRAAIGK